MPISIEQPLSRGSFRPSQLRRGYFPYKKVILINMLSVSDRLYSVVEPKNLTKLVLRQTLLLISTLARP